MSDALKPRQAATLDFPGKHCEFVSTHLRFVVRAELLAIELQLVHGSVLIHVRC